MSPLRLPFRHPGKFSSGAGKRSRTSDLRITNALLYQLSYAGDEYTIIKYFSEEAQAGTIKSCGEFSVSDIAEENRKHGQDSECLP